MDLSCHMGFLPKSEIWPTSITFLVGLRVPTSTSSLLTVSGSGYQCYVKCETVLRKIDGKIDMKNCGYYAKWRWWLMLHGWRQRWVPGILTAIAQMASCWCKKHHQQWSGNPKSRTKFHNYRCPSKCTFPRSRMMLDQHIVDSKNIAGNNQVTLTIAKTFEIYIYEIATDAALLTAMVVVTDLRWQIPNLGCLNGMFPTS